jgi:type IV secretion system protein VirB4
VSAILKRHLAGEDHLPRYNYHVRDTIVSLDDGRVMFTVRAKGVPFEVISDGVLENNYDSLNGLLLSIAKSTGSRLAVWAHLDHYETRFDADYRFSYQWLRELSAKYMRQFTGKPILENAFYLSFVLKPGLNDELDECVKELEAIQLTVLQSLRMYECEVLGTYTHGGHQFSQAYEFIGYLYNGFWERIPVTSLPMHQVIESSDLHFAYKTLETRTPGGGQRFSSLFDLKDFPEPTTRGKLNPLLELPFPFLLCCSFTFLNGADALRTINQTLNKMASAGDEAVEQMSDLAAGKGAIAAGEVYFGEFHCALLVHGASPKQAEDRGTTAGTTLSGSCGTLMTGATLSAPETFFSLFPGNVKRRPRPMPKTTRNLTGLFSMNTYSSGKQFGNPIGDGHAVIPLQTNTHGVYHFNFHYSLPDIDVRGDKLAGHIVLFGATGVGKTTLQTTLIAFLERFNVKLFGIDKDGSMRGMTEALGGTYFRLASGEPTGLNPFQLPDEPINRNFLYDLVAACGRRAGQELSAEDTKDIKRAVDNVFELPFEARRFGVLLQSIPDRGEDCLVRRLADWCYGEVDGRFAYALDNPTNLFDWERFWRVGFDVSDFLKPDHPATEPILAYLLHLKTLMQRKGGLLATVVEEFWLPISYPTTAAQIMDSLRTGRRRDEFIVLVTQSPEHAIKSPLLSDILEQTPTKIYLANPDAEYTNASGGGYIRVGLTPKEFAKLKKLGLQDYKFLVKQGGQASIVKLNLGDVLEDIAVLAMAAEDFPLLEAAKAQAGDHPDAWVPVYKDLRRRARSAGRVNVSPVSQPPRSEQS